MRGAGLFVTSCIFAALAPFGTFDKSCIDDGVLFTGWPAQYEGRVLVNLPLSETEERFARGFPGKTAKFTDGKRTVLMRWVTRETRKLHPAEDCFKSSGYATRPRPLMVDAEGYRWGSFLASRKDETVVVRELIRDDKGKTWSDVSAWYWAAVWGRTRGPWWTVTVVEKADEGSPHYTYCEDTSSR